MTKANIIARNIPVNTFKEYSASDSAAMLYTDIPRAYSPRVRRCDPNGKPYFAGLLCAERMKRQISQVQMAKLLKVTQAQYSKWETGFTRVPEPQTISRVLKVLKIAVNDHVLDAIARGSPYVDRQTVAG